MLEFAEQNHSRNGFEEPDYFQSRCRRMNPKAAQAGHHEGKKLFEMGAGGSAGEGVGEDESNIFGRRFSGRGVSPVCSEKLRAKTLVNFLRGS